MTSIEEKLEQAKELIANDSEDPEVRMERHSDGIQILCVRRYQEMLRDEHGQDLTFDEATLRWGKRLAGKYREAYAEIAAEGREVTVDAVYRRTIEKVDGKR